MNSWLPAIEYEFDYHKHELAELAGNLDSERTQRFKDVLVELQRQYDLLYEEHSKSDQTFVTLLNFLKDFPGRLIVILTEYQAGSSCCS